ncbi:MAG: two-component system sensor histidine kinase NtrB [Candidatus Kariarchaeaceae archaeon]
MVDYLKRYEAIFFAAPIAICVTRNHKVIFANPKYYQMFGYSLDDQIQELPLIRFIARDSRVQQRQRVMGREDIRRDIYETKGLKKDGFTFPLEIFVAPIELPDGPARLAYLRDISESKLLEKQLVQAQKLEAIGRLASGISHDFRNILAIIQGQSELLLQELKESSGQFKDVLNILDATERGTAVVKQLLAFSSQQELDPEVLNLNITVKSLVGIIKSGLTSKISIEVDLDKNLHQVYVDPTQIGQVIMNIVVNAKDAMPEGGIVRIQTKNMENQVMLSIQDTGEGIPPEIQHKIFDPFFSTKGEAGTGLGLATVYGIVEQSGGTIHVKSEPINGSTFTIYFPKA